MLTDIDIMERFMAAADKQAAAEDLMEKTGKTMAELKQALKNGGVDGRTLRYLHEPERKTEAGDEETEYPVFSAAPEAPDEWTDEDIDSEAFRAELREIFREPNKRRFRITMDSSSGIRMTGETDSIARLFDLLRESYETYDEHDSLFRKLAELAFGQRERLSLPWSYEIEAVDA